MGQYELLPTSRSGAVSRAAAPPRSGLLTRPLKAAAVGLSLALLLLVASLQLRPSRRSARGHEPPAHDRAAALDPAARTVRQFDVSAYEIDNLESVEVTLAYGDGSAAASDWVGVYCIDKDGDETQLRVDGYLDRRATSGRTHDVLAFGPLVNMRCALQFRLLAADNAVLATAPSLVRFRRGPAEPTQLHLMMTASPTEMRVMWTSADVAAASPRVRYGLTPTALQREAAASWTTYDADDMCAPPATTRGPREFRDPGMIYDALMDGLPPGVSVFYQVGSGAGDEAEWSDVRSFKLPPAKGVDVPLSMFVFGDLMAPTSATRDFRIPGSCGTTMELIARDLESREFAALMHVGDLSYAAGQTFVWDHFGALIEPVASRLPYMVSIGNHDFGYLEGRAAKRARSPRHSVFEMDGTKGFDAHGECGVPSEKRFHMPETGNGLWWYSYDIGTTHHTVLSGEHDFAVGSPMYEWLLRDLAAVDRAATPWLFVHMHRPLYCSVAFGGDFTRSLYLRDHLEKTFAEFRVDVVFSGHYHSYERTCPVYDDRCYYGDRGEARAPVHIMVGSGGANVDTFGHYRVGWSEFAKMAYGYGRLHVFNRTHALFEFVENDARRVTDDMWIVTDHAWTLDQTWRWRRVVFHPSLAVVVSAAVLGVVAVAALVVRRRSRHHVAKRR